MNIDYDRRIHSGMSFTLVNLSDTVDVRLIDLSAQYTNDDLLLRNESDLFFPRGFHANASGTLSILPSGNALTHPVSLEVTSGKSYRYGVRRFRSTGTSGISDGEIIAWR